MRRERRPGASLGEIERVYRADFGRFLRVAAAVVGDRVRAADVVQEAFALAVAHREEFRGEGPLEAWIWRTVVRTAQNTRRAPAPVPLTQVPDNGSPAEPPEAAARGALARLPERQRLIVFLRYYADLDYAAIADVLEVEPGTVGSTLHAAQAALRTFFEDAQR
jgi:RNA polymerase sigma-70 factor, ECF subfamily